MHRITLGNTEFEGSNATYLLRDGDEVGLIDTGAATDTVRADLFDGLERAGVGPEELDVICLTHWHFDHAGLAGELQRRSGATVYAHEADAPLIAGHEASMIEEADRRAATLREWGVPDGPREELSAFMSDHLDIGGESVDVTAITGGDRVTIGGVELEAVHLPGHAAGLVGYAADGDRVAATAGPDALASTETHDPDAGDRVAFTGDAILPKYTPNVGGADVRVASPLAQYVESLQRAVAAGWAIAYPGHRTPIRDPAGRAATILRHHRERTGRVIDALRDEPQTPWEVSATLFGELRAIHVLHGPGEAYAHLDHLAAAGVAERDGRRYRLVDRDPDLDTLVPLPAVDRTVEWAE